MRASLLMGVMSALCFQAPAFAYPARIPTHGCSEAKHGDVVIISEKVRSWEYTTWLEIYDPASDSDFNIEAIGNSVTMSRTVPHRDGYNGTYWSFRSLDKLYDRGSGQYYDAKVYFTPDFTWIEASDHDVPVTPVYSTVFFVGAPEKIYERFLDDCEYASDEGARFVDYDNLKESIQLNYADLYDPRDPRMIQYTLEAQAIAATIGVTAAVVN